MNSLRMAKPSRYKSATQRRVTAKIKKTVQKYNVVDRSRVRGAREQARGKSQASMLHLSRYKDPTKAVLNLLSPEAQKRLQDAGVSINITERGSQPEYRAFGKQLNIPLGASANFARHELFHAGLTEAPGMFSGVGLGVRLAQSRVGQLIWQEGGLGLGTAKGQEMVESAAITMGGAEAYPGYTPSFEPDQFSNFFNTELPSWQYNTKQGWNIGK